MKKYIKNNIKLIIILSSLILILALCLIKNKLFLLVIISVISTLTTILVIKNTNSKIFITEIKSEIKNITWINKKELNQSILTITAVIILSSFSVWIIDSTLTFVISKLI